MNSPDLKSGGALAMAAPIGSARLTPPGGVFDPDPAMRPGPSHQGGKRKQLQAFSASAPKARIETNRERMSLKLGGGG